MELTLISRQMVRNGCKELHPLRTPVWCNVFISWHHPLSILRRTVRVGGVPLGGTMPGFADKLNSEQIDDILAWVQSHWSEKIYNVWHERNAQASKVQRFNKKS